MGVEICYVVFSERSEANLSSMALRGGRRRRGLASSCGSESEQDKQVNEHQEKHPEEQQDEERRTLEIAEYESTSSSNIHQNQFVGCIHWLEYTYLSPDRRLR